MIFLTENCVPAHQNQCSFNKICCVREIGRNSCYECAIRNAYVNSHCGEMVKEDVSGLVIIQCTFCLQQQKTKSERDSALQGQKRAAEKMLQYSEKKFCDLPLHSSVALNVPKVDRGPLDPQNIHDKIVDFQNGFYRIGTAAEIIKSWFSRSELLESGAAMTDQVADKEITLREALAA